MHVRNDARPVLTMWHRRICATPTAAVAAGLALALIAAPAFAQTPPRPPADVPSTEQQPAAAFADPNAAVLPLNFEARWLET
jgi:hypothetical protein